jgi:hypothetical protein
VVRRGIDLASLDGSQSARLHADIVQGRPAISQTDHQPPDYTYFVFSVHSQALHSFTLERKPAHKDEKDFTGKQ